jgi:hypothetical protein
MISGPFFIGSLVGVGCRLTDLGPVWARRPAHLRRQARGLVYLVPFEEDEHTVFLKTIIPSRKATNEYLGEEPDHED